MHLLKRSDIPSCLHRYDYGRNIWADVTSEHKEEIWLQLDVMQKYRCAYCEAELNTKKRSRKAHIEHFRQRSRYPKGTFKWSNLFGSCNRQESCGKFKDKQPLYDYKNLIKMDEEDPEYYLQFLPDGNVVPKEYLTKQEKFRADETIRLFNLNGSLRRIRQTMVIGYLQTAEELAEIALEFGQEEYKLLLDEEIDKINDLPFSTAIKHILIT